MSTPDLTTTLRAHAPAAPDALRERVLDARPVQRRRGLRPVLVLAAAAVLAVAAALVHGLSTSSPQERSGSAGASSVTVPENAKTPDLSLQNVPTAAGGASSAGKVSVLAPHAVRAAMPSPSPGRLQHTDASITVRVDDLGATTTRATQIAAALGGYAQSVRYRTPAGRNGASYIELRIPAPRVKQALARLAGLGVLVSQEISIDDLTSTLQRQSDQIAQLRRRVAALNDALRNAALPDAQRVLLQIRLAESKRALAQRLHGRKGTVAAGTTARVSLVLTTHEESVVPAHRGRFGRMLHSAVGFLAIEGIVALFALIVISPVALALALLWFWRRRAVERLLME